MSKIDSVDSRIIFELVSENSNNEKYYRELQEDIVRRTYKTRIDYRHKVCDKKMLDFKGRPIRETPSKKIGNERELVKMNREPGLFIDCIRNWNKLDKKGKAIAIISADCSPLIKQELLETLEL